MTDNLPEISLKKAERRVTCTMCGNDHFVAISLHRPQDTICTVCHIRNPGIWEVGREHERSM